MNLGPNQALLGKRYERDLATPALLLDLDLFDANVTRMAELVSAAGKSLRPHAKAHKCVEVGRRQIAAGAVGLCCATVREAEIMAEGGISGLLVTTPVVSSSMLARLVAARDRIDDLAIVVDSEAGVEAIAAAAKPDRPVGVLVDIDMGQGRTGVQAPGDAVRLATLASNRPNLRYRGVQGYYGNLQHVPALADRRDKVHAGWKHIGVFTDALAAAGLPAEIVSGSGTGTHHLDLDGGPFTELQAGSYIFMDKQYGAVELAPEGSPFETAVTIATRVTSATRSDRVIVDAGFKAMATDAGPALVADGAGRNASYQFMGDEHGLLLFAGGGARPAIGDLVTLVAPHCDPTLNLHDRLHIVQGGKLLDIWPVGARGY